MEALTEKPEPAKTDAATHRLRAIDARNWSVERRCPSGSWARAGYFPTIESACRRLTELSGESTDAERLVHASTQARRVITAACIGLHEIDRLEAFTEPTHRFVREYGAIAIQKRIASKSTSWFPTLEKAAQGLYDALLLDLGCAGADLRLSIEIARSRVLHAIHDFINENEGK